ncbi:MAG: hypothetical protein J0M07_01335 [Anaerolineae bacterium]|nr:hypothetical protein [Anaerolineae bacterium]
MLPGLEKGSTNTEAEALSSFASMITPKGVTNWAPLRFVIFIFLGWITLPLDLWLRVEHGERALSALRVFNAFFALKAFWLISYFVLWLFEEEVRQGGLIPWLETRPIHVSLGPLFEAALVVAGLAHLWRINYRRRKKIIWHSQSNGISILEITGIADAINARLADARPYGRTIAFRLDYWIIYRFVEPVFVLLLSQVVYSVDPVSGVWLTVVCVCIFWRNNYIYTQQWHRLLDFWDTQLESAYIRQAAQGAPAHETAGVMVVPGVSEVLARVESLDVEKRVRETLSPQKDH